MIKNLLLIFLGVGLIATLIGCTGSGDEPYREELVVQGFMYLDQPLKLRITRSMPMGVFYDSSAIGVSGAFVRITSGTDTFMLVENPPRSGYYMYTNTSITVNAGQEYSLYAEAEGRIITAEMRAAGHASILSAAPDTVEYGDPVHLYTVHWSPDSLAMGYAVLLENLEPNWADDDMKVSGNNGPDMLPWNIWLAYPQEDSVRVGWVFFGFKGHYRARLITCNQAAWNYFWTYVPLQTTYNPVSNVQGALGIFAAGDADTTFFFMKDDVSNGPNTGG